MAELDPVTGPLSREKLRELAAAPFGKAVETIRRYDPCWGLKDGETIEWEVECRGEVTGLAYVKAASKEEAEDLASDLTEVQVNWDFGADEDFEVVEVRPRKRSRGRPINELEPLL